MWHEKQQQNGSDLIRNVCSLSLPVILIADSTFKWITRIWMHKCLCGWQIEPANISSDIICHAFVLIRSTRLSILFSLSFFRHRHFLFLSKMIWIIAFPRCNKSMNINYICVASETIETISMQRIHIFIEHTEISNVWWSMEPQSLHHRRWR